MAIPMIEHKADCDQFVEGGGSKNDWFVMTEPYPYTALLGAKTNEDITISVFRDYQDEVDIDMRLGCGRCQVISKETFNYEDFEYVD